jgi:2-polyprenyl-6-methoxyphenol hydroxylase-like FAD-dependent oxidoreductase
VKILVIGASAAGCFAALLLARNGHDVVVLDKDRLELAPDVESAASSAFRTTAPQIVQPHIILARCRLLLAEHLPDVYERLLEAGVVEAPLATQMWPTLADKAPRPGDEQLTMLMTRRSTLDWVLLRAVVEQSGITLRRGVSVAGLVAVPGTPPHVTGVRTSNGDLSADLVIDAAGRLSPVDRWLKEIGARVSATWWAECGVAYFSRHYKLRNGITPPAPMTTRIVEALDEFTVGIWGSDNDVMQVVVAPLAMDHRFKTLRHAGVFTAVMRCFPVYATWLDALDPITEVFPMGGVHNTLRRLVVDGVPVVTGLAAIGDSVCTTNPTFGRGLGVALWGAVDLLEIIDAHGDDPSSLALAMDRRVADHVVPFYEDQAVTDAARLAILRHRIFDAPAPAPPPATAGRVTYPQLRTASRFDPTAFRAMWRVMGMIGQPDDVYTDPLVVERTQQAIREHGRGTSLEPPPSKELLAALKSST